MNISFLNSFILRINLSAWSFLQKEHNPKAVIAEIGYALDLLKANVPRLYINLLQIMDVTTLADVSAEFHWECYLLQKVYVLKLP